MNKPCRPTPLNTAEVEVGPLTAAGLTRDVPITRPEFIRLPPPGLKCPWCGLSRSGINELILPTQANGFKPPVPSHVLRKRGARTGVRLIPFHALMSYLRSLPSGAETQFAREEAL